MAKRSIESSNRNRPKFVGVEVYFKDLDRARSFYTQTLGLEICDEKSGHHAKFDSGAGFVCLECKGVESYPSADKAVFFEVRDLKAAINAIGERNFARCERTWAVLHDPEGHNVLLLQARHSSDAKPRARGRVAGQRR
jgi:catechol 2,3-dioxygenase-like lactoylglutathione lyase family enzyme